MPNALFTRLSQSPSLLEITYECIPGINPNNKKILRILKISSDFQNAFLSIYSENNFQKSVQPAAPKHFVCKCSWLSKWRAHVEFCQSFPCKIKKYLNKRLNLKNFSDFLKNLGDQISQNFVRKFLRTQIFDDRIKPLCHYYFEIICVTWFCLTWNLKGSFLSRDESNFFPSTNVPV